MGLDSPDTPTSAWVGKVHEMYAVQQREELWKTGFLNTLASAIGRGPLFYLIKGLLRNFLSEAATAACN